MIVLRKEADARFAVNAILKYLQLGQDMEVLNAKNLRTLFLLSPETNKILAEVLFGAITRDTLQVKLAVLHVRASQDIQEPIVKLLLDQISLDALCKMLLALQDKLVANAPK